MIKIDNWSESNRVKLYYGIHGVKIAVKIFIIRLIIILIFLFLLFLHSPISQSILSLILYLFKVLHFLLSGSLPENLIEFEHQSENVE